MHSQPVPAVDQRGSSLGLFDKVSEEMWLGVVYPLDAALGDNAAAVRLEMKGLARNLHPKANQLLTPMTSPASFSCLVAILATPLASRVMINCRPLRTCCNAG